MPIRRLVLLAIAPVVLVVVLLAAAERTGDAQGEMDISGDWLLTLDGRNLPPPAGGGSQGCFVYLEQKQLDVSGAVHCTMFGGGAELVSGTVDVQQKSFKVSWQVAATFRFDLTGSRSEQARDLTGTYTLSVAPDVTNTFTMSPFSSLWGSIACWSTVPGPFPMPRVINGSLAALYALGVRGRIPSYLSCAMILDVNVDGQVDARDALLILQREAGLIQRLPVL